MSPQSVRAVFLGTPEAAVPSLRALAAAVEVVAAITRPDKPRGRSGSPAPSPINEVATALGIAVLQPANPSELTESLARLDPVDVGVVTAYGMLIRPDALGIPARGFLNLHFSLLPRWRGASPVVAALLAGDQETGVTLMNLDQGLDTGPIVAARQVTVGPDENGGELTTRLGLVGADLLIDNLHRWIEGGLPPTPQGELGVTTTGKLTRRDLVLSVDEPAGSLVRRIRALAPNPGAVLSVDGVSLRVLVGRSFDLTIPMGAIEAIDDRVLVGTEEGSLELITVQPPGKRPMAASAWLRGLRAPPRLTNQ